MVGLGNIDNFRGNLFLFSLSLFSHLASVGLVRTKGHAQYQENSYVCVCAKGYTGKHCELGKEVLTIALCSSHK